MSDIMVPVTIELISWLSTELDTKGWSQRELAKRAGISQATVSQVLSQQQRPTWDFCAQIAGPLGISVDQAFILAGLKRRPPPAVEEESEFVAIIRELPAYTRDIVLTMVKALGQGSATVAAIRQMTPLEREILDAFRNLDPAWQEYALEEVQRVENMQSRFIGEEEGEEKKETQEAHQAA